MIVNMIARLPNIWLSVFFHQRAPGYICEQGG